MQLTKTTPEANLFYRRSSVVDRAKDIAQKIVRFFPDTNLGNGHDGLAKIAKKHRIDVAHLGLGEYVIFVNKKKTALKMYAPNFIIVHQRLPNGARIDLGLIERLPRYFNGTKINYTAALEDFIKERLK